MKVEILIVTFARDYNYLDWCLRSIRKFATGFAGVTVVVPDRDTPALIARDSLPRDVRGNGPLWIKDFHENEQCGMLHHEVMICRADELVPPDTDYVFHLDADCIFIEPVCPDRFFKDGKPILVCHQYADLERQHAQHPCLKWRDTVRNALGWTPIYETMRMPGELYHLGLYAETRRLVEAHTKMPFDNYVLSCKNSFPQGYAEFNTLGTVAAERFPEKYSLYDITTNPWPHETIQQFWSHGPFDQSQHIPIANTQGKHEHVRPIDICHAIIGDDPPTPVG